MLGLGIPILKRRVFRSGPDAPTLQPLDDYTSGLVGYWGVKKRFTNYSGDCMRIRRGSDNAEINIPFDENGYADSVAIADFCTTGDGYLVRFYDQGPSNIFLSQNTMEEQPLIYNNGFYATDTRGNLAADVSNFRGFLDGGNNATAAGLVAPFDITMVAFGSTNNPTATLADQEALLLILFGSGGNNKYAALTESGLVTASGGIVTSNTRISNPSSFFGFSGRLTDPTSGNSRLAMGTNANAADNYADNFIDPTDPPEAFLISIGGGNNYANRQLNGYIIEGGVWNNHDSARLADIQSILNQDNGV